LLFRFNSINSYGWLCPTNFIWYFNFNLENPVPKVTVG
jgi:hypothetical protein